ncbi:hypothetical protein MPLSOD_50177 [Mesorhizobium sp. SOD10]|nr:hypothetical protein MPLSOD_50177 [Mesorhizobium sp. SOD10]
MIAALPSWPLFTKNLNVFSPVTLRHSTYQENFLLILSPVSTDFTAPFWDRATISLHLD